MDWIKTVYNANQLGLMCYNQQGDENFNPALCAIMMQWAEKKQVTIDKFWVPKDLFVCESNWRLNAGSDILSIKYVVGSKIFDREVFSLPKYVQEIYQGSGGWMPEDATLIMATGPEDKGIFGCYIDEIKSEP